MLRYGGFTMYKTIIIEDDLMVCAILEKQLSKFSHLEVSQHFHRGTEALEYLAENPNGAELIILDYYMPGMNGVDFLSKLRETNKDIQVIMITSADDYDIIRAAMCCGICDYVLKPFTGARLEKAITKFETIMKLRKETHVWTQDKVDVLLCPHKHYIVSNNSTAEPKASKINQATLKTVRSFMSGHYGENMPLIDVSRGIDLSTVTTRRYLKYLSSLGEIEVSLDCKTGGRPSELFKFVGTQK